MESYDQTSLHIKKQRHYFALKGPSRQAYGISSSHVWMLELDYKESWVLKNWCFWTVVLEKTLESPLDCKDIQPVHPKGDQTWVFIGRTDVESETPILWPPDAKSWHLKRPWCWERWKAGGEGDDRGWDGWMASPTQWTWVSKLQSWWWTGTPGVLHFLGSQRVGHNWETELKHHFLPLLTRPPLPAKCLSYSSSLALTWWSKCEIGLNSFTRRHYMSNNLYLRNNYISKYEGKKLFKNWDQYKNQWVAELE